MSCIRESWWWDAGWMENIQRGAGGGPEPLYLIRPYRANRLAKSYSASAVCTQIYSFNVPAYSQMMSPFATSHPCKSALYLFITETWNRIKFWIKSVVSFCLYMKLNVGEHEKCLQKVTGFIHRVFQLGCYCCLSTTESVPTIIRATPLFFWGNIRVSSELS